MHNKYLKHFDITNINIENVITHNWNRFIRPVLFLSNIFRMSFNQRSCVRGDNSQCQVRNAIYLKTSHTKYTQKQPTLEAYIFLLHHFEAPHPPGVHVQPS